MRSFKRFLISFLLFVLVLILSSVVLIAPYRKQEAYYYNDAALRRSLAGQVDFLVVGASHAMNGFDTRVLDRELGVFSYNAGGPSASMYGRCWMLQKELKRNPVKTVVIELSYQSFTRAQSADYCMGDGMTLDRMDTFSERLKYLVGYVGVDDWLNYYSRTLKSGLLAWGNVLRGNVKSNVDHETKGFIVQEISDQTLSPEEAVSIYNSEIYDGVFLKEELRELDAIMEFCEKNGVYPILAVVPISDRFIWQTDTFDYLSDWFRNYCEQHNCEGYDFNLLKNRYELFSDQRSFSDLNHMSTEGAGVFTQVFCDTIQRAAGGEDVSDMFYDSYSEIKALSPYNAYLPDSAE